MNIYHVGWVQSECFGLSAVIIAKDEEEALVELDLDSTYENEVDISLVGICSDSTKKAYVICKESL